MLLTLFCFWGLCRFTSAHKQVAGVQALTSGGACAAQSSKARQFGRLLDSTQQSQYEQLLKSSWGSPRLIVLESASSLTEAPAALRTNAITEVAISTWEPALPPKRSEADLLRWEQMQPPRWEGQHAVTRRLQGKPKHDARKVASTRVLLVLDATDYSVVEADPRFSAAAICNFLETKSELQ